MGIYKLRNDQYPNRYFNITSMGSIYDDLDVKTSEAHRHDYYTIVWVMQARGYHQIDFEKYELKDNEVYFVAPGRIHQIHTPNRPKGHVITFSSDFLALANIQIRFIANINLFHQYSESPALKLDSKTALKLDEIIADLEEWNESKQMFKDHALGALLKLFLIHCNAIALETQEIHKDEQASCVIADFRELVENNYMRWHKVKEYAEKMHITPKHLNAVIKELVGYTAKEYIQDRITTEAKRLIIHSDTSFKKIALDLGFSEPVHFTAFFKKCTGMSPSEFKEKTING